MKLVRVETVFQRWGRERQARNLAQWAQYGPAIIKLMDRVKKLEEKRRG